MKSIFLFVFSILALGFFQRAWAQDEFEKVEVLDYPRYSLTDKFTFDLDLSFLPLDAYYKPMLLEGAVSYQLNDWISFEPARLGWAFYKHDTGLNNSIDNLLQQASPGTNQRVTRGPLKDLRFKASSAVFLNLLYSKSNFFNQAISYHYWQIGSAISYYDMKNESQYGLDLIMRVRFFLNDKTTFNIKGGHTLGFSSKAPKNITFLGVGFGVSF